MNRRTAEFSPFWILLVKEKTEGGWARTMEGESTEANSKQCKGIRGRGRMALDFVHYCKDTVMEWSGKKYECGRSGPRKFPATKKSMQETERERGRLEYPGRRGSRRGKQIAGRLGCQREVGLGSKVISWGINYREGATVFGCQEIQGTRIKGACQSKNTKQIKIREFGRWTSPFKNLKMGWTN